MKFIGNPTGNIILGASRDHEFLLSHKGDVSNFKIILTNLQNQISISLTHIMSPVPSDLLHPTYNARNRDAQAEY